MVKQQQLSFRDYHHKIYHESRVNLNNWQEISDKIGLFYFLSITNFHYHICHFTKTDKT